MATIIDSLLVKLGLDSSEFEAKKSKVDNGLKDTGAEAEKTGSKLKKSGKDGADGFENVAKSAAKFLAIIGGTMAVKRFIENQIEANAALDRFAQNLDQSANSISAWSNAAELAGGSAEGLQGTMDMLSKSQTELQLTGQSSLIPYFSALGMSLADTQGKARPVNDLLLDLSDRFSKMDRTTANNMGRMMGIDQGTMQLLLKGRSEVELMIRRQKEYGAVTKQQAEEASRLRNAMVAGRQSFEAFGRQLLSAATPALEKMFALFAEFGAWCRQNQGFIEAFLTIIATGLAAVAIASIPINLVIVGVVALAAAIAALYDDYQTWKRGGDSLIDWAKWEPGINAAKAGLKTFVTETGDGFYRLFAIIDAAKSAMSGDWEHSKWAWNEFKTGNKQPDAPTPVAGKPSSPAPAAGSGTVNSTGKSAAGGTKEEQAAMAYFQAQGWSREQAAGLAANIKRESAFRPDAVGDNGKAYGIAQWHPDRQAEFKKKFGKDIQGSSMEEQMAFMHYELTQGNERKVGNILRGTSSAAEAAAAVSSHYERPADREGEAAKRGQMALAMLGGVPGASQAAVGAGAVQVAQANAAAAPGATSKSVETHIGEVKVYTAATDANGIAKDMGKSLDYLFTSQANYGLT